ncbi:MAG: hypothetical protein VB081_02400 [Christensenella sp.]|uniref:hypothetical protein n=1 Tax=Christensenella sp. TaxID=1935934 RepID=UPI002B1FDB66|nr:hypothetical protein [Christensenella sp.]MEA5002330.1 hypothetical protein [Christensenella sp.]
MAEHAQTPLGYLMEMLYIQGTKLASAIHVDRTVISRWKNGRTKLHAKSVYFQDIVNAILDFNEEQGLRKLERFFESVNDTKITNREELYAFVASWLLSEEFEQKYKEKVTDNSLYTTTYKIYKGPSGKRAAILDFLDVLLSLPGGESVYGFDAASRIFRSLTSDLSTSQKKFIEAEKKNHQLMMLFYMNRPAEQIYNMFQYWLPAFLSPNAHTYYTYDVENPFYDYIYNIKGKLALVGSNFDGNPANMYTAVYDDPMTVHQIDAFMEKHLEKFNKLTHHLENRDMCSDFNANPMRRYLATNMDQYVITESTPFITFSKETLDDVLLSIDLSAGEEKKITQFYRNCVVNTKKFLEGDNKTHVIFSADYIHDLREEVIVESPTFTYLLGRPIRMPSKFILREIEYFLETVQNNSKVKIGLRPMGSEPFIPNLNLWVKENTIAYFHPSNDYSVRVLTNEFASVNSFYSMIEQFWMQLPYECTDQDWVYEQMDRLMNK